MRGHRRIQNLKWEKIQKPPKKQDENTHLVIFPGIEPEKGESFSQVIGRVLAPLATGTGNA